MSDHFDGKKFFNPTLEEGFSPGFSDVFRLIREPKIPWPAEIKNQAAPNFKHELKSDEMAITFIGHATFLIQFEGLRILTDPVWSERAGPFNWLGPKRVRPPGIKMEDLPKIDLILISHNHYDHLDKKTLKKLNKMFSPQVIVPVGDKALVESIGMENVSELDWWESVQISSNTEIVFAPTQHSSARTLFDRDRSLWGSYLIRQGDKSLYFGGDAAYSTHYADIRERLGAPDIALLGIGAYLPNWFMQPLHMSPAEAVTAHKDLGAQLSIGMHYGTFQLSSEGFEQPVRDLNEALAQQGLTPEDFTTLQEGETRIFEERVSESLLGTNEKGTWNL